MLSLIISTPQPNQSDPRREKRASSILYGYRKSGTQARGLSQTLGYGNSKTEIKKEIEGKQKIGPIVPPGSLLPEAVVKLSEEQVY